MNTQRLEVFLDKVDDFDAVFYVGGYGREFYNTIYKALPVLVLPKLTIVAHLCSHV